MEGVKIACLARHNTVSDLGPTYVHRPIRNPGDLSSRLAAREQNARVESHFLLDNPYPSMGCRPHFMGGKTAYPQANLSHTMQWTASGRATLNRHWNFKGAGWRRRSGQKQRLPLT